MDMEPKLSRGMASAVRILVADELGLKAENVHLAKMDIDKTLHPIQFANLENSGVHAVKLIIEYKKESEAFELAKKYFRK